MNPLGQLLHVDAQWTSHRMLLVADVATLISSLPRGPALIGIDGRPCSGKTTLAQQLANSVSAEILYLDDFVLPRRHYPMDVRPEYPFPYMRYHEFQTCIDTLATGEATQYYRYDYKTDLLENTPTSLMPNGVLIVEGVSVLNDRLKSHYAMTIFVASNVSTEWAAIEARETAESLVDWKDLFLPSAEKYFNQRTWTNVDIVLAGRGIDSVSQLESWILG